MGVVKTDGVRAARSAVVAARGLLRGRAAGADSSAVAAEDRAARLIASLIALSDKVSSRTLRADILAALGEAGVEPIDVRAGTRFDPKRMRGVGGATAPDAAWDGRVA